jgi:gliding motility-associated protein GldM
MAVLSNMQAEVNKYELHALEVIQNEVGGGRIDVDRVIPMFRANANTVVAGTKYKAEVFLAATSSAIKPLMSANGKSLSVDNNGIGNLEFLASSDKYDLFGFANKKWSGKVTFKNKGKDTSFTIEGEYRVAKPYVDCQSSVPPSLYRNCSNQIKFSCPPLGADFNPNYNGSAGGEIITSNSPGKVVLVPKDPEMTIKITNNGAAIDQKAFRVLLVPKPTIKLYNGDREVNMKEGLKLPLPANLKIVVIPDPSFKSVCPDDAKYNPTETEVTVIRRRTAMMKPFIARNGVISMADIRKLDLKDGDRIFLEPKKVQRANFRGQIEDVNVVETFNISISTN